MQPAPVAYEAMLLEANTICPRRDRLDQRTARKVRTRTSAVVDMQGHYPYSTPYNASQRAWPVLKATAAPINTAHDGTPNAWEKVTTWDTKSSTASGLSPTASQTWNVTWTAW